MDSKTAMPSRRWDEPEWDEGGRHWTARCRRRVTPRERAAGVEVVVYGPTRSAVIKETVRMDHLWAEFPHRVGDGESVARRLKFLAGEATPRIN